jgi:hypothetical protein
MRIELIDIKKIVAVQKRNIRLPDGFDAVLLFITARNLQPVVLQFDVVTAFCRFSSCLGGFKNPIAFDAVGFFVQFKSD